MHRLAVMHDRGCIEPSDLPAPMRFAVREVPGGWQRTLAQVEAEHIDRVLAGTGGNRSQAAAILGIDRKTLRLKLAARAAEARPDAPA